MKWWPQRTPIGVHIDGRSVRCVQLERHRSALAVRAALCVLRRETGPHLTPDEARDLAGAMSRQGFTRAGLILSASTATCTPLDLPPAGSGAPLEQIARMEVARTQRLEPGGFELAMWSLPVSERAGSTHALAAAISHQQVESLVAPFDQSGLHVVGVDLPSWALARACASRAAACSGLVGIIDLNWDRATIVVLARAGDADSTIVYERHLHDFGLGRLYSKLHSVHDIPPPLADVLLANAANGAGPQSAAISRKLRGIRNASTEHLDALLPEVHQSLEYASGRFGSRELAAVFLTGGHARVEGLADRLASTTGFEVRAITPSDSVVCGPDVARAALDGEMLIALGLAMPTRSIASAQVSRSAKGIAA